MSKVYTYCIRGCLTFILGLSWSVCLAGHVGVDKAKEVAMLFMNASHKTRSTNGVSKAKCGLKLVYTGLATDDKGTVQVRTATSAANELFYVFNQEDDRGFVMVAANDAVSPILAFSNENGFITDGELPCNLKALFNDYRSAITAAIASGLSKKEEWNTVESLAAAESDATYLMTSKWDQLWPYNEQAPILSGNRCPTGCVATAMAQIMYYWKYPEVGHGEHSYYWLYKRLTSNFTKPFDWANMKDEYNPKGGYNEKEVDAIAHLMSQCGIAVDMGYDLYESGAAVLYVRDALCNHFDYNVNEIGYMELCPSNAKIWLETIKDNIDNKCPILYSTQLHAYVCDGYCGEDYLHINLGYGGQSDGFYKFLGDYYYLNTTTSHTMLCGIIPTRENAQLNSYVSFFYLPSPILRMGGNSRI